MEFGNQIIPGFNENAATYTPTNGTDTQWGVVLEGIFLAMSIVFILSLFASCMMYRTKDDVIRANAEYGTLIINTDPFDRKKYVY